MQRSGLQRRKITTHGQVCPVYNVGMPCRAPTSARTSGQGPGRQSRRRHCHLNTLTLNDYVVVDASATRPLTRSLHLFLGVENLFNVEYDTGRTPLRSVGWPRTVRAGVRVFLP
jgi:outer membrane receptor protein involved in Fe transport